MRKTYYIRFTRDGCQVEMKLRAWARENQHYFQNYTFTNSQADHPITHHIRDYCVRNLNGRVEEHDCQVFVYI